MYIQVFLSLSSTSSSSLLYYIRSTLDIHPAFNLLDMPKVLIKTVRLAITYEQTRGSDAWV
jgi:hypothetical protein